MGFSPPSHGTYAFSGTPRRLVIDTDMGSDDWMAILNLLNRADVLARNRGQLDGGYHFWDPLAAAILTENSLATFETRQLIIVEEGSENGRTEVSEGGASIRVAVTADGERFEGLFLDTLNAAE